MTRLIEGTERAPRGWFACDRAEMQYRLINVAHSAQLTD